MNIRGWLLGALATVLLMTTLPMPSAHAHATLWQSSPEAGETVGGDLHSITLQFFDLDLAFPQEAVVFDEAANELPSQLNQEDQRLVIALTDPIDTPGDYFVNYSVFGYDGDFTEEAFSFTWAEGAPEQKGITRGIPGEAGFDWISFSMLIVAAVVTAFLAQRFLTAFKEHRAAQTASPTTQ